MNFLIDQVTYLKEEDIKPKKNANRIPSNPMLEELIDKASYHKEEDITNVDLSTLKRLFGFKDNDPNLYICYLSSRKNIAPDEHQFYSQLIKQLVKADKKNINAILEILQNTIICNE